MIEKLNKASFDPLLNDKFEVFPVGMDRVELELVQIKDKSSDYTETFSLLFRGPRENVFRQNTHRMKHPVLGEFDVFIGPVMYPKTDGTYYEVVFNRLKQHKD
ncbi:MAG: hypothetical protein NT166_18190 [Candidatus Aminicenantes bacterium]|nr:hypothetical protein [Candidatus Aminicenantes bacterium]